MKATYTVKVYVDADGDMVIVQNPTLAPAVEKSDYEPKTPEADASVDADTVNDATAFLETFFKLYPTATEKELAYYVLGNVIEPIGRDYLYSELVNPIFIKDGDNVKVKVVTMPPVAAQMMMKAVDFLLLVPYPSDLLYPYSGDTSTLQSTL